MDSALRGKSIVVTGASGGIGAEISRVLAAEGVRVGVHYGQSKERADRLVAELANLGAEAHALGADLRSEAAVDAMIEGFAQRFSGLDGLVANAGAWPVEHTPIAELSLERWTNTLGVNLTGSFLSCRAFLRGLTTSPREAPAIVLIGSTAAVYGEEGHGDYAASKSALVGLMLSIKNEIVRTAPRGRINLIHPGWVATPMARAALADKELVQKITSTIALRKVGVPEDIAHAAAFLLSERLSGHLSGTVLPIAGGMEGRVLHSPK